eukprot:TRINITY_DN4115_c1_g3_i1.p2 TRINITY_DN4115_c1_g3~~TRINITY_DN4115_c1_g3_i1.p2  ORF type:complete len:280 (-),score=110.96 TRINITY_DN4115_c1_g3_i1:660-1499(-)
MASYVIHPLTLCRAEAERGMMTYMAHHGEKIWRPYIMFLIQGEGTSVLVDSAIEAEQYKDYHPLFREKMHFEQLITFDEALAKFGLAPEDIELVIQTHLHFDHCYNTARCSKAKVLVQQRELEFARDPHPVLAGMYRADLFEGLDFQVIDGAHQVMPGLELLPSPGHTPGCQTVLVDTTAGKAAISGFCCIAENFDPPEDLQRSMAPFASAPVLAPAIHVDLAAAFDSVLRVKEAADIILPMHEPDLVSVDTVPQNRPARGLARPGRGNRLPEGVSWLI